MSSFSSFFFLNKTPPTNTTPLPQHASLPFSYSTVPPPMARSLTVKPRTAGTSILSRSTIRGMPGMVERLKIEVPAVRGFTVSDLAIGGGTVEYENGREACWGRGVVLVGGVLFKKKKEENDDMSCSQ